MSYVYPDAVREDFLRMIPEDGHVIGSIGCGHAATEGVLVRQGREVHGVDISEVPIRTAAGRLTSARVIRPDDRQPFEADSLDGLILADVIEHIPAAWQALRDFAKAVRPGGWVVISVPNMRNIHVLKYFIVRGDWPEDPTGIFDATHIQVMSRKRLIRWCADAGLGVDQWFDRYPPSRPRRYPMVDRFTFRCFNSWLMYQLQVRCRKQPRLPASDAAQGQA